MTRLSPAERAILINQLRILGLVENETNAYANDIEVLSSGYEAEYEEVLDGLGEPLEADHCKYVQDVLWLWYLIKLAKNKESLDNPGGDRDKQGRLRLENLEPKFPGFDGNNEGRLLSYAQYLIFKKEVFQEHNHYLNSHGAEPDYRLMLSVWREWGSPTEMTLEQADELLEIR